MCGLVGMITSSPTLFTEDKKKFFRQALFSDTLRGVDSTGVFLLGTTGDPVVYKRALAGYDFVEGLQFDRLLRRTTPKIAMGHNRAATRGTIMDATAHPFTYGNIVLCHNGTLHNHKSLKDGNDFAVDSEYIAYSFHKFGVKETLKLIRGAFALTWYDTDTNKFHVVRNGERELHYGYNIAENTLMYASEGEMLAWIAERNGLSLKKNSFYEFEEGKLYTIDPDTLAITTEEVEFAPKYYPPVNTVAHKTNLTGKSHSTGTTTKDSPKADSTRPFVAALHYLGLDMEEEIFIRYTGTANMYAFFKLGEWYELPKHANVVVRQYSFVPEYVVEHKDELFKATVAGCKYDHVTNQYIVYIKNATATGEEFGEKKSDGEDDTTSELYPGPNHTYLDSEEWNKLTKHGCDNCGGGIPEKDAPYTRWSISGTPICTDCTMAYFLGNGNSDLEGLIEE